MNKLAELLYENARLTNAQLATMLSVSEAEVEAGISELIDKGIIRGFKTLIDWEKGDAEKVTALIEIKVTPKMGAGFDEIAHLIMGFEEVESVYLMSGGYDLMLLISGKTFKEVALFVAKRLAPLDSVMSTATHFVLRRYKDMGVPLCDSGADDRGNVSL